MRSRRTVVCLFAVGLVLALVSGVSFAQESSPQSAMGTAFTYQGQLEDGNGPVDGDCDLRFKLYNAATDGTQIDGTQTLTRVGISEGLFTVQLDFGTGAFGGYPRWLEIAVRCPAGSGSYVTLSPRQPLTPAPYALYAASAPWSGLTGLTCAAGQVAKWDGSAWACSDDNTGGGSNGTTYTAGTGLNLSGTEFSLQADYRLPQGCTGGQIAEWDGSTWVCAEDTVGGGNGGSAHNHLGQTWTGSDNPLTLNGSFDLPDSAPLVLANSQTRGDGLRISGAGDDGLQVDDAGGDGLFVDLAGDDGVNVFKAGNPSGHSASTAQNGFEVAGAEGNGLFVGRADGDGVHVYKAGNPDDIIPSARADGFEVEGAQGHGLWVGYAGQTGVHVNRTGQSGVQVEDAGYYGVVVRRAGSSGVQVTYAGYPSNAITSPESNGFEVGGAESHGLYVGWANVDGVYLRDSGDDGLHVLHAADEGVRVTDAGDIGVYARTEQADHEWGFYTPDKIYAGTSLASGGPSMIVAQNGDAGPLETGDVVAVSGIGSGLASSEFPVAQVRRASDRSAAVAGVVYRRFSVEGGSEKVEGDGQGRQESSAELYSTEASIEPGDHLLIVVLGPAQVKVEARGGSVRPGDLLAFAGDGRATRAAALAPAPGAIVGQAMESVDGAQASSLAWVLVMPR